MPGSFWEQLVEAAKRAVAEPGKVPSRMPSQVQPEPSRALLVDRAPEVGAAEFNRADPERDPHPEHIHLNRKAVDEEMNENRTPGGTTGGYGSSYWAYEGAKNQSEEHPPPMSKETREAVYRMQVEEAKRQRAAAIIERLTGNN
jgi:hypothetical protein